MNRLFIICPFSNLEIFLKNKYGDSSYFLTFPGGYTLENIEVIYKAITEYSINEIVLVSDINCRFSNSVITQKPIYGFSFEKFLEDLYIENYNLIKNETSIQKKLFSLITLNLNKQLHTIQNSNLLLPILNSKKIKIKGLIYDPINYIFKTIDRNHSLVNK